MLLIVGPCGRCCGGDGRRWGSMMMTTSIHDIRTISYSTILHDWCELQLLLHTLASILLVCDYCCLCWLENLQSLRSSVACVPSPPTLLLQAPHVCRGMHLSKLFVAPQQAFCVWVFRQWYSMLFSQPKIDLSNIPLPERLNKEGWAVITDVYRSSWGAHGGRNMMILSIYHEASQFSERILCNFVNVYII